MVSADAPKAKIFSNYRTHLFFPAITVNFRCSPRCNQQNQQNHLSISNVTKSMHKRRQLPSFGEITSLNWQFHHILTDQPSHGSHP